MAEAAAWYEARQPGLGAEFVEEIILVWDALAENPFANSHLDALERETGLAFPPLYRDFLQYQHFVDLTEVGVRFERHLCHD